MSSSAALMAPVVEQTPHPFPRQQSSPDLFNLPLLHALPTGNLTVQDKSAIDWKNWASISSSGMSSFDTDFQLDTSIFFHGKGLPKSPNNADPVPVRNLEAAPSPRKPQMTRSKTTSLIDRPRSWLLSVSKPSTKESNDNAQPPHYSPPPALQQPRSRSPTPQAPQLRPPERGGAPLAPFANLVRWSRITSTRSPSPKDGPDSSTAKLPSRFGLERASTTRRAKPQTRLQDVSDSDSAPTGQAVLTRELSKPTVKSFTRASSYFSRIKHKPTILTPKACDGPVSDKSCASSSTSLEIRASNSVKTSLSQSTCSDGNVNTSVTDESSSEMNHQLRDPLWPSFRALEAELKIFGSRQAPDRVGQVKTLLLPFLRNTIDHESTQSLSLHDVDRRAVVLNKWWTTVLEMLGEQAHHPAPGAERPILLEAATLLMMRSEWRRATARFRQTPIRSSTESCRTRSCTNASKSTDCSDHSASLAESAEHNVRTMFVSNLVKQMGYVVDKMSMRHAPLNLVTFAGKTCAYAFFFAPGVADALVRLWSLTRDLVRRAGDEFGLPRQENGEETVVAPFFPPHMVPLVWRSVRSTWDMLKQIPKMSLPVARIAWTGPWVSRWKGRDSDLFFIFCKHFHFLSNEFFPPGLSLKEKARSPAFVLVHAQLLSILDTTIHRQSAIESSYGPPLADSINGVDASALAMPLPPTNLMKGMAENRLVILLRDVLLDEAADTFGARHTFAEAFAALMRGATSKTSQYNSAACFTLCDFLEEALLIYHEFERRSMSANYTDWAFWLEVCKRILGSLNAMSEIRIFSFIYAVWDAISQDPGRKSALCLDWLLSEETFDSFFNNWCPMVRAYYQRLLCWRVCHDNGNASEVDLNIMLVAAARLRTVRSHYLYLKKKAEESGRTAPSTLPMCPAPGKKFIIIRHEVNTPPPPRFISFDDFARRNSTDLVLGGGGGISDLGLQPKSDSNKRRSLLGKVLAIASGGSGGSSSSTDALGNRKTATAPLAEEPDASGTRRETAEQASRGIISGSLPQAAEDDSLSSSSGFLDEPRYAFRFILGWQQRSMPTRGRELLYPKLPAPAQALVAARALGRCASSPLSNRRPSPCPAGDCREDESNRAARRASLANGSAEELMRCTKSPAATLVPEKRRLSASAAGSVSGERRRSFGEEACRLSAVAKTGGDIRASVRGPSIRVSKPTGIFAKNSVYTGRSLAEWAQVVVECNNFMDRRLEEGVSSIGEVEIPRLGVEGFRKMGG